MATATLFGSESPKTLRRRPLSERIEAGVGALLLISVVLIAVLALAFLAHNNRTATKGYELKMLRDSRAELLQKSEVLSMQIADLQSLVALENDETIRQMVKVEEPRYIRGDTAVAKR